MKSDISNSHLEFRAVYYMGINFCNIIVGEIQRSNIGRAKLVSMEWKYDSHKREI